jgi:signal transduction histidine kinase
MIAGELERTGGTIEGVAHRFDLESTQGARLSLQLIGPGGEILFQPLPAPTRDLEGPVSVDAPIIVDGKHVGAVRVVKPTVEIRLMLTDMAPTVLVISLVLGGAAAIAAVWIGRAIARPIERLSGFAERVSAGKRTGVPPAVGAREVKRLIESITSMRSQLEGRPFVETFAADLSHELKNPVAAIRASAELLEEGAIEDPEAAARFVKRIRESTQRIERLLGDLLGLARIEARGVDAHAPVELAKVVDKAVAALLDDAGRVTVEGEGDTRVRGDAAWLGRAVTNLIGNALLHSREGSPVRVRIGRAGDELVLSVFNEGEVPRHVQTRLFRRFVTTRQDRGGTGLGLAIVRAVAESHGGRAELASAGPPGVEFRVYLPPVKLADDGSRAREGD